MKNFKTKVEGHEGEFNFVCYENTEPINIGDKYIYFFWGMADVQVCDSESCKFEINKNDRVECHVMDFVTGFWENCFKIQSTDFDLNSVC